MSPNDEDKDVLVEAREKLRQYDKTWNDVVCRVTDEDVRCVYKEPKHTSEIHEFAQRIYNPTIELVKQGVIKDTDQYAPNLLALHRFNIRDIKFPVYCMYTGTTTSHFDVAFWSIEVGTVLDFSVPRGLLITDEISFTKPYRVAPLENVGDTSQPKDNPLLSLVNQEIENRKKSELFEQFHWLEREAEIQFLYTKFKSQIPKWILVLPRENFTILIVHSGNSGHGALAEEVEMVGKIQKFRILPPRTSNVRSSFNVLRNMVEFASYTKTDSKTSSLLPRVEKERYSGTILGHYLIREAKRKCDAPEGSPIALETFVGTTKIYRLQSLTDLARQKVELAKQAPTRKLHNLECPKCNETDAYNIQVLKALGYTTCKKCGAQFLVVGDKTVLR